MGGKALMPAVVWPGLLVKPRQAKSTEIRRLLFVAKWGGGLELQVCAPRLGKREEKLAGPTVLPRGHVNPADKPQLYPAQEEPASSP